MNTRRCRLVLALLLAAYLVLGFCVPTSLAYIATESGLMVNAFSATEFELDAAKVEVCLNKVVTPTGLDSIGPEGFFFNLTCDETGESLQMITDKNGKASAMLTFTQEHLNQTYIYRLSEINDGRAHVDYSEKVYEIAVSVALDANRNIVLSLKMDGEPVPQVDALFQNIYVSQIVLPDTGDDSCLLLYVSLLLLSGAALALLRKRKTDW